MLENGLQTSGDRPKVRGADVYLHSMDDRDKVMVLGIVYRVFEDIYSNRNILSSSELQHV